MCCIIFVPTLLAFSPYPPPPSPQTHTHTHTWNHGLCSGCVWRIQTYHSAPRWRESCDTLLSKRTVDCCCTSVKSLNPSCVFFPLMRAQPRCNSLPSWLGIRAGRPASVTAWPPPPPHHHLLALRVDASDIVLVVRQHYTPCDVDPRVDACAHLQHAPQQHTDLVVQQ